MRWRAIGVGMLATTSGVVACGSDPITSEDDRESAIEQVSERLGMSRDAVIEAADGFCTAVKLSDSVEDYADRVLEVDQGASLILTESTETMTRIGGCEQDYFDIGGSYDEDSDAYRMLEEVTTPVVVHEPATPVPEIGDGGPASLILENGESFEFDAVCSPGVDDGNRYTIDADDGRSTLAVSSDELGSGDDGDDPGELVSILVTDSETGALRWYADNIFGNLDVTVSGSDIRASGLFSTDLANTDGVDGEFTATC